MLAPERNLYFYVTKYPDDEADAQLSREHGVVYIYMLPPYLVLVQDLH